MDAGSVPGMTGGLKNYFAAAKAFASLTGWAPLAMTREATPGSYFRSTSDSK